MCGIAGLIHRGSSGDIGAEMTTMLQALKHRGPDSTGFAIYGIPVESDHVMRFKVAEQEDIGKGFEIHQQIKDRKAEVDSRIRSMDVEIVGEEAGDGVRLPLPACAFPMTTTAASSGSSASPTTSRMWKGRRSSPSAARWS